MTPSAPCVAAKGVAWLFGDLGFGELLVILVAGLVIFGPQRLPEVGRALGTALRELRRASQELMTEVAEAARDLDDPGPRPSHRPPAGPAPDPGAPPRSPEADAGTASRPDGPSAGAPTQPPGANPGAPPQPPGAVPGAPPQPESDGQ